MKRNLSRYFPLLNIFLILLWLVGPASAHGPKSTVPDAARIGFEGVTASDLKALLTFLAADELEGRETGKPGLKIAARFLETQFTLAGLTPPPGSSSMRQPFPVVELEIDEESTLTVTSVQGNTQRLYFFDGFLAPVTPKTSVRIAAPVVFAGYGYRNNNGRYDDYKSLEVANKTVIALDGTPESTDTGLSHWRQLREERRAKVKIAENLGVAAIIFINDSLDFQNPRLKRYWQREKMMLAEDPSPLPQFVCNAAGINPLLAGNGHTVATLRTRLASSGRPFGFEIEDRELEIDLRVRSENLMTQNIVAFLEGTDPDLKSEVVAFGAHYDHIGIDDDGQINNGADDDGSGTVALLELAHAFSRNGQPGRSLLFIAHSGEEKGLLGSIYYTRHPLYPLDQTTALLNIDMIGRNEKNSIYVIGSNFLSQELHEINEAANAMVGLQLDYLYNTLDDPLRFFYRSDHYNYAKEGIPIIFYFSGTHEDYHQPTDTIEKINFMKVERVVRLVYLTGWKIANLNHDLSKDGLLKSVD